MVGRVMLGSGQILSGCRVEIMARARPVTRVGWDVAGRVSGF
jgi:hypothetical protein